MPYACNTQAGITYQDKQLNYTNYNIESILYKYITGRRLCYRNQVNDFAGGKQYTL